ncbi:hypothetical protein CHUAL_000793 [Chamberlinius hualienensis]|uniref:Cytochrome P450 3200A2 n=1 Tax=Chamberlinius hualienensis TaxID=1551368 RepID=A0A1J1E3R5_9MYRI|nr:cytochrome P450 3200A2 [Chamberlinius hualienensis]
MALEELFISLGFYIWIIIFSIIGLLYWYLNVPPNLPPGSAGLPIVGYLPYISSPPYKGFSSLEKKFGPIFHLYLGNRLVIVLNDYVAIKEAFIKQADVFAGRIRDANFVRNDSERHGVVNDDGEYWKQHRRFVLHNLRDNGVGKLTFEPLLLNEIRHFLAELKKHSGKPTPMKDILYCSLSNNVHLLVTGNRYDYEHPTIQRMIRALHNFSEHGQPLAFHTFFPWISKIPGSNRITKHELRWQDMDEIISIANGIVTDNNRDRQAQYECLVDAYIDEMKSNEGNLKSIFSKNGLLHVCRDLMTAGAETSSRTMLWGMIYLTNHPEVQKKAQKEIDAVIGRDREPSYNDRSQTPYTVAMITEIHRIVSLVPMALPHRNMKEIKVLGYTIPKDTMIIANLWHANNDPKLWGDPENFRPERFIGSDGRLVIPEYFVPFSIGKRACAGEPLARMELYLYFTSLLQHFDIISLDGAKLPLDGSEKVTRSPIFDVICVRERSTE